MEDCSDGDDHLYTKHRNGRVSCPKTDESVVRFILPFRSLRLIVWSCSAMELAYRPADKGARGINILYTFYTFHLSATLIKLTTIFAPYHYVGAKRSRRIGFLPYSRLQQSSWMGGEILLQSQYMVVIADVYSDPGIQTSSHSCRCLPGVLHRRLATRYLVQPCLRSIARCHEEIVKRRQRRQSARDLDTSQVRQRRHVRRWTILLESEASGCLEER